MGSFTAGFLPPSRTRPRPLLLTLSSHAEPRSPRSSSRSTISNLCPADASERTHGCCAPEGILLCPNARSGMRTTRWPQRRCSLSEQPPDTRSRNRELLVAALRGFLSILVDVLDHARSEERRVGKECKRR